MGEGEYLHKELTHQIIGILFDVYKEIGYGLQEKYYQRAVALRLSKAELPFQREQHQPIQFDQQIIGRYFVDFVVDNKVVLELKVANGFFDAHLKQVLGYLKTTGLQIGLLGIVTPQGVQIKRVISTKDGSA